MTGPYTLVDGRFDVPAADADPNAQVAAASTRRFFLVLTGKSRSSASSVPVGGRLDEVHLYDRALTGPEIGTLPEPGMGALWAAGGALLAALQRRRGRQAIRRVR